MKPYRFTNEEIYPMLNFVRDYHLELTHGPGRRTNQGRRGFGETLDAFLIAKLTEVAACKIIERFSSTKELFADFDIYSNQEVGKRRDPDITKVKDKCTGIERIPKVKVEVKKTASNEHWFNAREEQIREDLKNNKSGYMVFVSLSFADDKNRKERDITAAILKNVICADKFDLTTFSNSSDLEAKIEYAYSYKDLEEKGFYFPSNLIMPDTEFGPISRGVMTKGGYSKQYEKQKDYYSDALLFMKPYHSMLGTPDVSLFEKWNIKGRHFAIFKKNKPSNEFIHAYKEATMENENLGRYELEEGKTYRFHLMNKLGRGAGTERVKQTNEYSFSRKKLENLQEAFPEFSVESVCKTIACEI